MSQATKPLIPLNLQFFSEEPPAEPATGNPEPPKQENPPAETTPPPAQTFTKSQRDAAAVTAKRQGKIDILNAVGIDTKGMDDTAIDAAVKSLAEIRTAHATAQEASQTEAERREKADKKAATERAELERQLAEKDAAIAKRDQMDAIREAGITDKVTVIGVHALVTAMVNEETDFNAALAAFIADEANAKYTATAQAQTNTRTITASTDEGGARSPEPNVLQEQYKKAKAAKDGALMTSIARKASAAGIKLYD